MAASLILLAIIVIPAFIVRRYFLSPMGIISCVTAVFLVAKYLICFHYQITFLHSVPAEDIKRELSLISIHLGFSFALALAVSYWLLSIYKGELQQVDELRVRKWVPYANIILLVGITTVAIALGKSPFGNPLGFRRMLESQGMYYFLSMALFISYMNSIYAGYRFFLINKRLSVTEMLSTLVSLSFCFICGLINALVLCIVMPLFFLYLNGRRRLLVILLILVPIAAIYVRIYSVYRDVNTQTSISLSDASKIVFSGDDGLDKLVNRFDYLENFAMATKYLEHQQPNYGAAMAGTLVQFIPRALWEDKPVVFSRRLTEILIPDMFDGAGSTANFGEVNEFFDAFGLKLGMLVSVLSIGILVGLIHVFYISSEGNPHMTARYLLVFFPYVMTGYIAGFVMDLAFPLLILNTIYFKFFVETPKSDRN